MARSRTRRRSRDRGGSPGCPRRRAPRRRRVTPGTISNGMPAARTASASSPPRPNTNGSPPLRRTTSAPSLARARSSSPRSPPGAPTGRRPPCRRSAARRPGARRRAPPARSGGRRGSRPPSRSARARGPSAARGRPARRRRTRRAPLIRAAPRRRTASSRSATSSPSATGSCRRPRCRGSSGRRRARRRTLEARARPSPSSRACAPTGVSQPGAQPPHERPLRGAARARRTGRAAPRAPPRRARRRRAPRSRACPARRAGTSSSIALQPSRPRRRSPAAASTIASKSPAARRPSRVSRLPCSSTHVQIVAQRAQLRGPAQAARADARARRAAPRSTRAPQSASRGSSRAGRARRSRGPRPARPARPWRSAPPGRPSRRAARDSIVSTQRRLSTPSPRSPPVRSTTVSTSPPIAPATSRGLARAPAGFRACRGAAARAARSRLRSAQRAHVVVRVRAARRRRPRRAARTGRAAARCCRGCARASRLLSRIVGSCSSRETTARASASMRARSRGDAVSQRPAFSSSTRSTTSSPRSRSAAIVGRTSTCAEPAREARDLLLDDRLRRRDVGLADREVVGDRRLEVVDVAQRDARELAAARVDVARHGDVDQEQRPAVAGRHHELELLVADDRVRRGGRRDHDVGRLERLRQAVEAHDRAAEPLRHRARAVGVPVGHEHRADAARGERLRGQLAGLAGADDHHGAPAQARRAAAPRGRPPPTRGSRGCARSPVSERTRLPVCERRGEQAVGERAGRPGLARELVGAPHLSVDLVLADHHRLEARGHAEEVARRVAVALRVDRRARAPPARAPRARRAASSAIRSASTGSPTR